MVARYVPEAGDIAWLNFDPQVGHEQGRRRPALVLTDQRYNRASGLVVVCPLTSKRKLHPFSLPVVVDKVEGAVLVDHIKSMDWQARNIAYHSKADAALLNRTRSYISVLLQLAETSTATRQTANFAFRALRTPRFSSPRIRYLPFSSA